MAQRKRRSASQNDQTGENYKGEREPEDGSERPPYRELEHEPYDDPDEHHRIERHRFAGGLPPTPERYALAREQWSRIQGALIGPSMNPAIAVPESGKPLSPQQGQSGEGGPKQ